MWLYKGAISSDGGAVHDPPLGWIVGHTPVQHGPVVPNYQIPGLPSVRINSFRAHAELGQRLGQRPAFVYGPADHMRTMTADIINFASGSRVATYQRLLRWRQFVFFGSGKNIADDG